VVRERVTRARQVQQRRFRGTSILNNAQMTPRELRRHCALGPKASSILEVVVERLGMSARAYDRILKVARTIADLDGADSIDARHISEAVQYRSLDRRII